MQRKQDTKGLVQTPTPVDMNPLRTGHLNKGWTVFAISILGIMFSFIIMSLFSEKAVKIKVNGEKFAYPEVRLFLNYFLAFVAATVMRFVNREKISAFQLLDPVYKNENYILSSIFLFFCKSILLYVFCMRGMCVRVYLLELERSGTCRCKILEKLVLGLVWL